MIVQGIRYFLLQAPPREPDFVLQENPSAIRWIDSLKTSGAKEFQYILYNPNFLTDYQGYMLGLTPQEIDRILVFRAQGNWFNSEEEFWAVTKITDSRKSKITARLHFKKKVKTQLTAVQKQPASEKFLPKDINEASANELRKVKGIGPVLSERIIKFRNRLGGFMVDEQLYDVYGLDSAVVERVFERYRVAKKPELQLININEATVEEIASLVYLTWEVAHRIVAHREQYGPLESLRELTKIEEFPADKIERISLYLSL